MPVPRPPARGRGLAAAALCFPWALHAVSAAAQSMLSPAGLGAAPDAVAPTSSVAAAPPPSGMRLTIRLGATVAFSHSTNPTLAATPLNGAPSTSGAQAYPGGLTTLQMAPTIKVALRGPTVSGSLDYAATAVSSSQATQDIPVRHTLRSTLRLDVLRDRLSVDGSVQQGQQAQSAFGTPLLGGGLLSGTGTAANALNTNQVNVLSAQVSPVFRARLLNAADVELRYARTQLETDGPAARSQAGHQVQAQVSGGDTLAWSVQGQQQTQVVAQDRRLQSGRAVGLLSYALDTDLRLRAGMGLERQNLTVAATDSANARVTHVTQAGATWTPTPRTSASIDVADRYFGTGWQLALNQRFSRLGLRLSAGRTVSDGLQNLAFGGSAADGTSFSMADLYGRLLAVTEPDPARREEQVSQLLRARGLDGSARVTGFSQILSPSLQDRLELGIGYALPRQTLSFVMARVHSERLLKDPFDPTEDLARFGAVSQTVLQGSLSHRLTPDATMTFSWGQQRSEGQRSVLPVSLSQAQLNGTVRFGPNLYGAMLLRDASLHNPNLATPVNPSGRQRDTSVSFVLLPQF